MCEQANRFGSAWSLLNGDLHMGLTVDINVFFLRTFFHLFFPNLGRPFEETQLSSDQFRIKMNF
jgi:hypothetical protein